MQRIKVMQAGQMDCHDEIMQTDVVAALKTSGQDLGDQQDRQTAILHAMKEAILAMESESNWDPPDVLSLAETLRHAGVLACETFLQAPLMKTDLAYLRSILPELA